MAMDAPGFSLRFTTLPLVSLPLISLACVALCFAGSPSFPGMQMKSVVAARSAVAARVEFTAPQGGVRASGRQAPKTLDLRAPELQKWGDAFHASAARNGLASDNKTAAALAEVPIAKPMSGAEAFARRVHEEGLPVARLWETKSALVSVGLNQKGKPGLWLIQKTH
jgi:hypothetical protein